MAEPAPVLSVQSLRAGYGETNVLFDLSFDLLPGTVLALIGRNGAGKSTTIKAIIGIVRATQGRISFQGRDITARPIDTIARAGIAYVPEERRIFGNLTVHDNLRVARRAEAEAGVRAPAWTFDRLYTLFPKLAELRHRQAGLLSGGEQQMLCIARGLATNPTLLLLDEPSEGLAPVVVEGLQAQIRQLKSEGLTIVLSEQNMPFARALGDRVVLIDRGEVRFNGSFAQFDSDDTLAARYLFAGTAPVKETTP
jgi:branched-chain amino acid transport system ATP-binding protein